MLENSTGDGDHPAGVPAGEAPAARPDEWVAPGGIASGEAADAPAPLVLTYAVTLDDMTVSALDNLGLRRRYDAVVWKAEWRRSLWTLPLTLGLVLLANLFMLELGVTWSVLSTIAIGGLLALVRWSQIDHIIKRSFPVFVEKQALAELAKRGDLRSITADATGVVLADASSSARFEWGQVRFSETERHILLTVGPGSWAIPKRLGEPLAHLVRVAHARGAA